MAATCSSSAPAGACPALPREGSETARLLSEARSQAGFAILYPCYLPNSQRLETAAVTGTPGRQQVELTYEGPFELIIRQAQFPPAVSPDPAGASRTNIDLFPNVQAIFIQVNDGSSHALYHLFWNREGIFYELQAVGPPLQQRQIRQIATSLQ